MKTNTQKVTELMEFSECGGLMQLFVLSAIESYAKAVISQPEGWMEEHLINEEAWKRCAEEAMKCLTS